MIIKKNSLRFGKYWFIFDKLLIWNESIVNFNWVIDRNGFGQESISNILQCVFVIESEVIWGK